MSNVPPSPNDPDGLQFDRVEPVAGAMTATCVACGRAIADTYFTAGAQIICPDCRQQLDAPVVEGSRSGRFLKATLLGVGAGLLGAALWYGIRWFTKYEIGIVAVVVGWLVGSAVRKGSNHRGGRGYQLLAVALTYLAICLNYAPDVFQALVNQHRKDEIARTAAAGPEMPTTAPATQSAPADAGKPSAGTMILGLGLLIVIVAAVSLAAPFLGGMSNVIGLLIIGFALWEAWRINRRPDYQVQGPFTLAGPRG